MLSAAPMELFNAVILDCDLEKVTEAVVRQGVLHLANIGSLEGWAGNLAAAEISGRQSKYQELEKKVKNILRKLEETKDIDKEITEYKPPSLSIEEITDKLDEIESFLSPKLMEKESQKEQLNKLEEIYKQIDIFGPLDLAKTSRGRYSFLEVVTGKIDSKNLVFLRKGLEDIPNIIMPFKAVGNEVMVLVMVLKRDHPALEKVLNEAAFEKISVPQEAAAISGDAKIEIRKNIQSVKDKISAIDSQIGEYKTRAKPVLLDFLTQCSAKRVILSAQAYFQKTDRTYLISGWIPVACRDELIAKIKQLTGSRCYIYEEKPEKVEAIRERREKVPVLFNNPAFLKPFEMLITTYGIPEYKTIDPTIFVAISFLIMFGAMFGDVGQGLILFILGLVLRGKKKQFLSKAGVLIAYCGVSSILFGFLYGSVFGMENIIPALWMNPFNNILFFLKLAVLFGVFMISLGITVNIVNAFRTKDVIKGVFDKAGLIGGFIYWAGVGLAIKYLMLKSAPPSPKFILCLIGIPVLALFLKAPAEKIITKRGRIFPEGFMTYFMETVVEIIEIFIGYLANTLSYIRIAAFSLAHAGLFLAVFSLVDLVKNSAAGTFWSVVIIILGNILILVLEGTVVTIQSIRLEYYEFFSKFFEGEGKQYKPIKLGR